MANEFQKLSGDYQRTGKEAISSMLRSAGDYRKSLEEISFELAEFSKRSVSQAIEAQAQLAKKTFAAYIGELTKFSMFGLYGPFSRNGSSEARGGEQTRDRGAATRRRVAASRRKQSNNTKEGLGSGPAQQKTAAQRASTHRKTGPAKTRKTKRQTPARAR